MTVKDLIAKLEEFPDEARVHFAYNYGDYWRTQVAPEVREVREGATKPNARLDLPEVVDEDEQFDWELAVVLR